MICNHLSHSYLPSHKQSAISLKKKQNKLSHILNSVYPYDGHSMIIINPAQKTLCQLQRVISWLDVEIRQLAHNIFITLMDNQFINAPLLVNKSAYTDHKDELIKKLQTKNQKLKSQLIKIQRTIQQKFADQDEPNVPKKRESIFSHEDNFQVLSKQLANTYKRIKMYQYQIGKLEDPERSMNLSQKTSQFDVVIKQKRAMASKLKIKLVRENKVVQDNIKKLEKDNQKEELEVHMKKMTEESKFFKKRVKDIEAKEVIKAGNMKKQYEAIKKMEKELVQNGLAGGELEDLKRNAINSVKLNTNNNSQTRRTMQETKKHKDETYMSGSEEEVEDRTRQHFESLLSEVNLLQKMQNDHEKQMVKSYDQKVESINKNMESRNRLLQCQNEIQNLQKEIQVIKGKVIPSNMKPTKPLRSLSSHQGQNPNKLLPAKYIGQGAMKSRQLTHINKANNSSRLHQQS